MFGSTSLALVTVLCNFITSTLSSNGTLNDCEWNIDITAFVSSNSSTWLFKLDNSTDTVANFAPFARNCEPVHFMFVVFHDLQGTYFLLHNSFKLSGIQHISISILNYQGVILRKCGTLTNTESHC